MLNNITFIEKSKKIHGDKYDYSSVEYEKSNIKVKIICKKHGVFFQTPSAHLQGRGCVICGGSKKYTNDLFIKKSKKIHGDKYDYSLVDYKSMKSKVKIICRKHKIFEQKPESHLNGHICKRCYNENRTMTDVKFIKKSKDLHGDKYDYSLVDYKNSKTKVKIICKEHGVFEQVPSAHLSGQGCKYCADITKRLTIMDFIKKSKEIHGDKYDYCNVKYVNNYTKVEIICDKHGSFFQSPNYHMLGQGCPNCQISLLENNIKKLLDKNNINYEQQKTFEDCKNINKLPFDFYLIDFKICIECNGKQHYKPVKYFGGDKTLSYIQKNDKIKKTFCIENNIKYIEISYLMLENEIEKIIDDVKDGILF